MDRKYVEDVISAFATTVILLIDTGMEAMDNGADTVSTGIRINEAINNVKAKAVDLILNPDVDEKVGASV